MEAKRISNHSNLPVTAHSQMIPKAECIFSQRTVKGIFRSDCFPFIVSGKQYTSLPVEGIEELRNRSCELKWSETSQKAPYRKNCEERLSKIICKGFNNIVSTRVSEEVTRSGGTCHNFVNYLALDVTHSETVSPKSFRKWYDKNALLQTVDFDEKKLEWGDIIQVIVNNDDIGFGDDNEDEGDNYHDFLAHSLFYIGDSRCIHKVGWSPGLWCHDLNEVRKMYPEMKHFRILKAIDRN